MASDHLCVAVVGLGYVGLPLSVELGKVYQTRGFDVDEARVSALVRFEDSNGDVSKSDIESSTFLTFSSEASCLSDADVIIVAVPTPIDNANKPDLSPLLSACDLVGANMSKDTIVVFESTVYPGVTEDVCVPRLELASKYKWKRDFFVGYSPERINPGDRDRPLKAIKKIVAGDTATTAAHLFDIYGSIITAGIHLVSSIKVAEAAKVIENTQRDLNIALMNELAIIFDRMSIDTSEVIEAAATKWNFIPFYPGLVGGHCIGVDPYYLTHKAEELGYHPEVILAGRRINDGMASFIVNQTIKKTAHDGRSIKSSRVLILGITFKENCPDLRNSKVVDMVREFRSFGCIVDVHDPVASPDEAYAKHGIEILNQDVISGDYDVIVLAVKHEKYLSTPLDVLSSSLKGGGLFVDVKSTFSREQYSNLGIRFWRL